MNILHVKKEDTLEFILPSIRIMYWVMLQKI